MCAHAAVGVCALAATQLMPRARPVPRRVYETWQGKRRRRSVGRRLDGVGRRVACGPTSTSWG